jgi:hypothetical protein
MKKLIRKILREEIEKSDRHYRMLDKISDHVHLPYFESMEGLTIYDKDDQEYIMKKILGEDIIVSDNVRVGRMKNGRGNEIYWENLIDDNKGEWEKSEYDNNGNKIYSKRKLFYDEDVVEVKYSYEYDDNGKKINVYEEHSDGEWLRREYDDNGNEIFFQYSIHGDYSQRSEYDDRGNMVYYEESDSDYWDKYEYDDDDNKIYKENSYGEWVKWEYDDNGNEIYYEDSRGAILDNR